jgi:CarD family transcriptional regulator
MGQNKKVPVKTVATKPAVAKPLSTKPVTNKAPVKAQAAKLQVKPVKTLTPKVQAPKAAAPKVVATKPQIIKKPVTVAKPVVNASPTKVEAKVPSKAPVATKAPLAKPAVAPAASKQPVKAAIAAGQPARHAVTAAAIVAARAAQAAPAVRAMPAAVAKPADSKISAPATPKDLAQKAAEAHQSIAAAAAKKPVSQRHGFKTTEWIVYPAHGVGRIVAIEEQEIAGMALELFVIQFEKDKMTLRVPTGKSISVGMRKLADDGIVKRAMETLKGRARIKRTMWSRRAQEFETKINSGDLVSIAEVVRDLFRAENQPEQSYSERQLYEAALDRMAREIAAVEKLDDRGAVQRITEVLSKSAKGRRVAAEEAAAGEIKAA